MPPLPKDITKKMTWSRWMIGFRISLLEGAVAAIASFGFDLTLKQAICMTLTFMGKKASEYVVTHPIDSIEDTVMIRKEDLPPNP